jgi:hypothetical protein
MPLTPVNVRVRANCATGATAIDRAVITHGAGISPREPHRACGSPTVCRRCSAVAYASNDGRRTQGPFLWREIGDGALKDKVVFKVPQALQSSERDFRTFRTILGASWHRRYAYPPVSRSYRDARFQFGVEEQVKSGDAQGGRLVRNRKCS